MDTYSLFKKIAFNADPEKVHEMAMKVFSSSPNLATIIGSKIPKDILSYSDGHMQWDSPIGLAAGFDKNAEAIDFFSKLGFGAVEVGTVTPIEQVGNPRPRIWRYPEIESLRNAMGFPNHGAEQILKNINQAKSKSCLGVNIGKNKETSREDTPNEYAKLYEKFAPVADYIVINISSPNTPGLRDLQTKEAFSEICLAVNEKRAKNKKPLYLKISPDLADESIYEMVDLVKEYSLSGIIATNTTIQHQYGNGGLSGKYLEKISSDLRNKVCQAAKEVNNLSVIGVGGISSLDQIIDFWKQGGDFVQIYSSFIFHGPKILKQINNDLVALLNKYQVKNLQDLIRYFKTSN